MAPTATLSASIGLDTTTRRSKPPKWAEEDLLGPVEFTLAYETETFDRAFRLVHDQYVSRDYMAPDPSGRRINLRHALPSTRVFVAEARPDVVGTVTLFQDSALGLPMDDLYKAEVDALRADGRRLAEASHLATVPGNRMVGIAVLMRMFRMMLLYGASAGLDDLCLVVNPRHLGFYEKFFDGEIFGEVKCYGSVNGAEAVPLRLDLDVVRDRIADGEAGRCLGNEIRSFLYDGAAAHRIARQLSREAPRSSLTAEQFDYFFNGSAALRKASPEQRLLVESLHRDLAEPPAAPDPVRFIWEPVSGAAPNAALALI